MKRAWQMLLPKDNCWSSESNVANNNHVNKCLCASSVQPINKNL
jgi:hypothetical protein